MKLIVGGDSLIGRALAEVWREDGVFFHASTRRDQATSESRPMIDLESAIWPETLQRYESSVICAGITNINECERRIDWSRKINVSNTIALVGALIEKGVSVLFISSSQVFDGTKSFQKPSDPVCPTTEYGRQKVETEKQILKMERTTVLRLPKVEDTSNQLIKNWKDMLHQGKAIHPYKNIYISVVKIKDAARYISSTDWGKYPGLWHYGTTDELTYADYARTLCNSWGYNDELVKPINGDLSSGVHKYSSLSER